MATSFLIWWRSACFACRMVRHTTVVVFQCVLFCLSVFGAVNVYQWLTDESPALELGEGSASMIEAYPGDSIVFYQRVKKLRDCPGRIVQVLSGDCGYHVIHDDPATLVAGFEGRFNHVVRIPFEANAGQCSFRVKARYNCNPFDFVLQRQIFESAPIPFIVKSFDSRYREP